MLTDQQESDQLSACFSSSSLSFFTAAEYNNITTLSFSINTLFKDEILSGAAQLALACNPPTAGPGCEEQNSLSLRASGDTRGAVVHI